MQRLWSKLLWKLTGKLYQFDGRRVHVHLLYLKSSLSGLGILKLNYKSNFLLAIAVQFSEIIALPLG